MNKLAELYDYGSELNVLIVEDDLDLLYSTRDLLSDIFKSVTTATNGKDGLDIYLSKENKYFDLIITDINMPILDGFSMIEKIRETNLEQEFIIISAYNDPTNLMKIIDLGITNFILKPIKRELFNNVLHKVCESIHTRKNKIKQMIVQSKQAVLGEMLDIIAHQWLNQLSILTLNLQVSEFELANKEDVTKDTITECIDYQYTAYKHMESTLNELRNFYRNKDFKTDILVVDLINSIKVLIDNLLVVEKIEISTINCNHYINININEFKQVIINFLQNSIDAYKDNDIDADNRKIVFEVFIEEDKLRLNYKDFAGGIDEKILNTIFDANITTKSYGTGMGTYLSKIIVEKNDGKLSAYNHSENGACFDIVFNKYLV